MKIEYPAEQIEAFTRSCLQESPVGIDAGAEKVAYRRFHRLLLANHAVQQNSEAESARYCKESTADSSQAFLLFFLNLNKASLSSLRSSIENAWRYLLSATGGEPDKIDSVPELVSECRALNLLDGLATSTINRGYILYRELCQAVHSTNEDYLNTDVPFRHLTSLDPVRSALNLRLSDEVFQHNLEVFVMADFKALKKLDASSHDGILDGLPKGLKKALHA